jgi:hypothetical protein
MRRLVAEHVGVAEGELSHLVLNDIVDREAALFPGQLGVENDLQEQIAQLFFHVEVILLPHRPLKFLRFFEEVAEQARVGLLTVPGAASCGTQPGHDAKELVERVHAFVTLKV